jgi:tetratricopeptide (TPR) repeat protein/ADP-heptose:LPS heptosyltransferase
VALCQEVLVRAPRNPAALRLLGILWLDGGRAAEAIAPLREALRADPADLRTLDALSAALMAANDHAGAEQIVRQALALDGRLVVAHMRLGLALGAQGRWGEAARAFEAALEIAPRAADAHHNLGDALTRLQLPHEAIDCFRRALEINPENPVSHNSLGLELQELGLWGAARQRYQRALALDPDFADARYNMGILSLFRHEFESGWRGYEYRLRSRLIRAGLRKRPETLEQYERLPRWGGPSETGVGEVAIWAEQGIGDQILFSTLIPDLLACGVPILYEVDRRLLPAYQRAFPGARFVPFQDPPQEALQRADRVLLAGSLPGFFRRSRPDFERQPARLLGALPERVAHYRQRLDRLGPGPKIALSWRSTREDWFVQRKNAPLADFATLLKLPGVKFADVQYGDTGAERASVEAALGEGLLHFDDVDYFNDLEEVLAILEACDLVITTSNATAHFAGALGKRTWLLFLADRPPFHYWAHGDGRKALWYPSVEIVTDVRHADWRSLIALVAERLAQEAGPDSAGSAKRVGADGRDRQTLPEWLARARALRSEDRLGEAVAACRNRLAQAPGDAEAWCELAHALRWQGEWSDARAAATRAIEIAPRLARAWFNLGAIEVATGEPGTGIASYRRALDIDPEFAEAWSNLGEALGAGGDRTGEIEAYRRALAVNPQLAPAWSNLGNALLDTGRIGGSLAACRRATELDPQSAAGWNNLGNALHESGEEEAAVTACETALRIAPELAEAWSSLGAALHGLGRYEDAIRAHGRARDLQPRTAHHYFNLGTTLMHYGRNPEAIDMLRRGLQLDPGHAAAHWDLSFALLGCGRLREGWEECEWRWRRPRAEPRRYTFTPWDGDASSPRRLLLWAEQGVGDQIMHASMIPELAATKLDLTLEIDPRLLPLARRSFPGVKVVPRRESPAASAADFDCQAPLGSLGRWLRPSFESFPAHRGYLKPDPARAGAYRSRLLGTAQPAQRVIGVSWRSANREFGAYKSCSLTEWTPILRAPHARFVDLQYGDTASERGRAEQQSGTRIEHLPDLDLFNDLEGLAALCAACDLVITASNATAHVAGALGRPVWLIVPTGYGRIWYWFSGRRDSPWYPSMRVYSQAAPGDWSGVLDEVARDLRAFVAKQP